MKKYTLSYLTENYYLDTSVIGNAGIYAIDDNNRIKVPTNAKKLVEEIVTLFGYSFTRTKWLIHDWAKSQRPDLCLKFYWSSQDIDGLDAMRLQRERTLQKWLDSGLLDGMDGKKDSIAALYEAQAKQLLR
jgi:hypothetical protein